jgi:two-component system chemotaxis response regulator CheY
MTSCLVVDDSPTVRRVIRRIVSRLGFEVVEAEEGRAALAACRRRLPDLIVLDWNMPEMDGMSFLRSLRRLPQGERPVVIFCTTVDDLPHIEEALDAGADEYIMKPFDEDILLHKLSQTGLLPS